MKNKETKMRITFINENTIKVNGRIVYRKFVCSRAVFFTRDYVIKFDIKYDPEYQVYSQCKREWDNWQVLKSTPHAVHFAPCTQYGKSHDKHFVVQKRVKGFEPGDNVYEDWALDLIDEIKGKTGVQDMHGGNYAAFPKTKTVIVFDYALGGIHA